MSLIFALEAQTVRRLVQFSWRMQIRTYVLSAALFLLAVHPSRADSIVNGSFENFVVGSKDVDFGTFLRLFSPPANTDITGWTISGSSGGRPNSVDLTHSSLWPAFAGTQSLDMEGDEGASGVIFQSFATTPDDIYNLSFEYGNNPARTGGTMNVLVTGSGTLLNQSVSHNTSTFANMDYRLFSQTFTANSATTTLQFSAVTNSGFGVVLDAVSVNPTSVPEPFTLTLLLTGIALLTIHKKTVGLKAKRRSVSRVQQFIPTNETDGRPGTDLFAQTIIAQSSVRKS